MRTELSDGTINIRAYQPGIELAVFEAAAESARHVAESMQAWQAGTWYDFAITRVGSPAFLGRVGLDRIRGGGAANVGY
jgi:hypothetical protein